ncbi:hypothetical protein BH10PAT4_BH10PAT4_1460 [soil metagenome]
MYRRPSKKRELTMRIISYCAMVLSVITIVSVITFLLLGYRLDTDNGRIEQGALLQFETIPSGATVTVDGKELGSKTSTKSSVLAGTHTMVVQKEGYDTWQKTLDVKAGTLTWFDYIRLVPTKRAVESVAKYESLFASKATADGNTMIVQQLPTVPSFQIVDMRSDTIKSTTIVLPKTVYSDPDTAGVTHSFSIVQWDTGGRYVLVQHTYADKKEWLVMDTKDVSSTKNITKLLDVDISKIVFSGTSGNILYALTAGDIRKLDLSAGTISRSLVTKVSSFELFTTNVITYVGTDTNDATKSVVGLYRDGDDTPHILRSTLTANAPLHITTTHYFNQDYVAISQGKDITILSGSYPSNSDDSSSLKRLKSFVVDADVVAVSFSPNGDYLLAKSGDRYASYDIEHDRTISYNISTKPGVTSGLINWLDDDHTWSDYDETLMIREFDGTNEVSVNRLVANQGVTISQNDKYFYSFGNASTGYQLQRVRMLLP